MNTQTNLHCEFVRLAFDINRMKNKLMSILLEIYEREIYKNHGCSTIYEYGFKYARLSREVVQKALRTTKHVEDKPFLKEAIEGEGIHKVALVATIATKETDEIFAKHVKNMSKPALAELAKEVRGKRKMEDMAENEKCQAASGGTKIELDAETEALFLQLKKKYAKDSSNKYALKILLQKLAEKDVPGDVCSHKQQTGAGSGNGGSSSKKSGPWVKSSDKQQTGASSGNGDVPYFESRYIKAHQNRQLLAKHKNTCAYPNCNNPHDVIHHRTHFSFARNHKDIIPLCKAHHEFAHNGLIAHELKQPSAWRLNLEGNQNFADAVFAGKRMPRRGG